MKRREFLFSSLAAATSLAAGPPHRSEKGAGVRSGATSATVARSLRGTPEENLEKAVELCGGVAGLVEENAVVVIKPNVQWWNQGAPHLGALGRLVELIMDREGGFSGEVVVAENCHRGADPVQSAGWSRRFDRNGTPALQRMGDAVFDMKRRYEKLFCVRHWVDVGAGGRRIYHPREGSGYVYCDGTGGVPLLACGNDKSGAHRRQTIMSYPVFITDLGTVVDFKNGVWEKGSYTGRPLRFVNLAALNHHSTYCGMTSSIKNYLGVADLSGGADPDKGGRLCGDYFNFHSFPFDHWGAGPQPGMLGRAVGTFMATVRRADLNITTAEWVGLSSRVDPPVARTQAVLASTDPVALDYHAAKYLLYPNSRIRAHNPDRKSGPLWNDLRECAEAMGGTLNESNVEVLSYDRAEKRFHADREMALHAPVEWGSSPKAILKYAYLRMFS